MNKKKNKELLYNFLYGGRGSPLDEATLRSLQELAGKMGWKYQDLMQDWDWVEDLAETITRTRDPRIGPGEET
jgi:hypothetical protein